MPEQQDQGVVAPPEGVSQGGPDIVPVHFAYQRLETTMKRNDEIAAACGTVMDAIKDNLELDSAICIAFGIPQGK